MISTRDTGILPEPILRREALTGGSEWSIFHPGNGQDAEAAARYGSILAAAWDVADQPVSAPWRERIGSSDPAVRFWAVHGLGWCATRHGEESKSQAIQTLESVLADADPVVQIVAAWWLLKLDSSDTRQCLDVLRREITSSDPHIRQQALVAIDSLGERSLPLWESAAAIEVGKAHKAEEYSRHMIERIRARLKKSSASPP
jgi:HEAT repeat protein